MPKQVDHEQRRREIAEALVRLASTRGLHSLGMRDVAAEAGISVRLIQYYFQTKEKLLLFSLQHLGEQLSQRFGTRLRASDNPTSPRNIVESVLVEGLPTDEESRTLHVVYTAYHALAMTDADLAPYLQGPDALEDYLVNQLRSAQHNGEACPDLDPRAEIVGLLATSAGLGTSVLVGQRSADTALAILRYQLDRVFQRSR